MSTFDFNKKREHEDLAIKALTSKDYSTALSHLALAAQFAYNLANSCSGRMAEAYIQNANGLLAAAEKVQFFLENGTVTAEAVDHGSSKALLSSRPTTTLADVEGMEEAKDEVRLSIITNLRDPKKAKKFGLEKKSDSGKAKPMGLLLYGLPGTGKTFFAKAVAGELGLPFYVIKPSDIFGKYVGESEQNITKLFADARSNKMSVIFIDEINGILTKRSSSNTHETSSRVVDIILAELDGVDSDSKNPFFLIGATNYPDKLDDAGKGRFDTFIEVELPKEGTRRFILRREFSCMEIPMADEALEFLVKQTNSFSCRDLVNLSFYYRKMAAKDEISSVTLDFCERYFKDEHLISLDIAESIENFKKTIGKGSPASKKK